MRVTNLATHDRLLADLQRQSAALDKAAQQVSSGKRNQTISDDPVAGATIMRSDTGLRALTGYSRSITTVRARLDSEEATLDQVGDLMARAKELGIGQAGANANGTSRAQTAVEVDGLISQVISLGNLKVGNEFVFGGFATNTAPFDATGAYLGTDNQRQAEIGAGLVVDTVHNGKELLTDSGVLASLTELRDALQANDPTRIQNALSPLDGAIDQTQTNLAQVGTRYRALDGAQSAIDAAQTSLTNQRSASADIPIEEAMLHFTAVQTALQAAMLATSKQMQQSLADYLPL